MTNQTLILLVLLIALLAFWFCYRAILRNAVGIPTRRPKRSHHVARQLKHHIWLKHPTRRN